MARREEGAGSRGRASVQKATNRSPATAGRRPFSKAAIRPCALWEAREISHSRRAIARSGTPTTAALAPREPQNPAMR